MRSFTKKPSNPTELKFELMLTEEVFSPFEAIQTQGSMLGQVKKYSLTEIIQES